MIEISRMGRQAEKVAGLWAGHGEMCRLPMPPLPPGSGASGSHGTEHPAAGPLWGGPALLFGAILVSPTTLLSGAFSPACKRKPRFIGDVCRGLERLLPAPSHSPSWASAVPVQKTGVKLTWMRPGIPRGCCEHHAVRHQGKPLLIPSGPENSIICGFGASRLLWAPVSGILADFREHMGNSGLK